MHRINEITILPDFKLQIVFDTNETKIMDFKSLYEDDVFKELKKPGYFAQVSNRGYFIEWPHEQDLSADTLYAESNALQK